MTQQISIIELSDDEVIKYACTVLEQRLAYRTDPENVTISSPDASRRYLMLKLGEREQEVFAVMFLDNRHRLIKYEELFYGTIDGASVHPREVVKAALRHNAAALIIAHNHPSGVPEPSRADESITRRLKEALAFVDIRVLDHIVVGGTDTTSFAERGLI
ncbi:MAG: DNA repair protein RadC [Gammaproteobacteria bacterium HGW-Gammaproteobacteria-1]|jgi:DNA repair protein RadC|nr:MAG: DNA repair protein RadC [Gammaproteobacteria bacterium HGW-Gammaproteobacteria-1]